MTKKTGIKILSETYYSNEEKKTTVCNLSFKIKLPEHMEDAACYCRNGHVTDLPFSSFTVIGKAKCHPNDEFDMKKGEKIAFVRAKINMYHKIKSILRLWLIETTKLYTDIQNLNCSIKCACEYEKNYIEKMDLK